MTEHLQINIDTLMPYLKEIADEYLKARVDNPTFYNLHEAYAIMKEEFDEFWEAVKLKHDNLLYKNREFLAREEAKQIAAMALGILFEFSVNRTAETRFDTYECKKCLTRYDGITNKCFKCGNRTFNIYKQVEK